MGNDTISIKFTGGDRRYWDTRGRDPVVSVQRGSEYNKTIREYFAMGYTRQWETNAPHKYQKNIQRSAFGGDVYKVETPEGKVSYLTDKEIQKKEQTQQLKSNNNTSSTSTRQSQMRYSFIVGSAGQEQSTAFITTQNRRKPASNKVNLDYSQGLGFDAGFRAGITQPIDRATGSISPQQSNNNIIWTVPEFERVNSVQKEIIPSRERDIYGAISRKKDEYSNLLTISQSPKTKVIGAVGSFGFGALDAFSRPFARPVQTAKDLYGFATLQNNPLDIIPATVQTAKTNPFLLAGELTGGYYSFKTIGKAGGYGASKIKDFRNRPSIKRLEGSATTTETSGLMDIKTPDGKTISFNKLNTDAQQLYNVKYRSGKSENLLVDLQGVGYRSGSGTKQLFKTDLFLISNQALKNLPFKSYKFKRVGRSRAIINTKNAGIKDTRLGRAMSQDSTFAEVFQVKKGRKTVSGKRRFNLLSDVIPTKQPKTSGVILKDYEGLLFNKRGYALSTGFKPKDLLTDFKGVGAYRSAKLGKKTIIESISISDAYLPAKRPIKIIPSSKKGQLNLFNDLKSRGKATGQTSLKNNVYYSEVDNIASNLVKRRARIKSGQGIYEKIYIQTGSRASFLGLLNNININKMTSPLLELGQARIKTKNITGFNDANIPLVTNREKIKDRVKYLSMTRVITTPDKIQPTYKTPFISIPPFVPPTTPKVPFIPLLPDLDFTGRRRKRKTKVRNLYGYSADFTSAVLGIRLKKRFKKGYIFSGFERRGI